MALPALEIVASRDEESLMTGPRPLVLLVTANESPGGWPDLAMQSGGECHVTDFENALDVARVARPKLIVVHPSTPTEALPLIRQLRTDRQTRSAGVAVEVAAGDPLAATALRKAGANLVGDPDQERTTWDRRVQELLQVPLRRGTDCSAWFTVRPEGQRRFSGRALNVSVHGMLSESTQELAVGTTLDISLALAGDSAPVSLVGQVIRTEQVARHGFPCYGLKFLLFRSDARERIGDFVDDGQQF